jgi:cytidyltransferase-like protein
MSKKAVEKNNLAKKTRIMLFGTFDGLHKGHLNLFKQARRLSRDSFLIVSVARDKNVKRIKGKLPFLDEEKRLKELKKIKIIDKVLLANIKNYFSHIKKEKPSIIALGYDQKAYIEELKRDIKKNKMSVKLVRLKPFKEKIYKSHLLNKRKE